MITKWQYKVVRLGGGFGFWDGQEADIALAEVVDEELLNSLGDEGWDLVSVTDYAYAYRGHALERSVAYLKKEVTRAESGPP